jgi:hypothetical protein
MLRPFAKFRPRTVEPEPATYELTSRVLHIGIYTLRRITSAENKAWMRPTLRRPGTGQSVHFPPPFSMGNGH